MHIDIGSDWTTWKKRRVPSAYGGAPTMSSTLLLDSACQPRAACASTVLVVDDDEAIRTTLAEILEVLGYRVSQAADGVEAVELLSVGLQPSAIVLDMMMPRMDGWTFLAALRANPKYEEVRVVVASAVVGERPAGADALLKKPFDLSDLYREVARLCAH